MSGHENNRYIVQVYVGALSLHYEALSVEASKQTTSEEIVQCIFERLCLKDAPSCYELAEVVGDATGQECKERRLSANESPVQLMLLWPKINNPQQESYRFYLREKLSDASWNDTFSMDPELIRDYLFRFLYQPKDREYPDLCQLPDLNEHTLLENLKARFQAGHIYTYVGSILIALNPFKFHPIYNPKYVKLYQNCRMASELPPHIFAVADNAYYSMLKEKRNQCVVISGESGSGKTESTNFLLHHLTALSKTGTHGSGVEQTILSAGPVLEAFGNAKTAHNNNSSRFGKFIQVNYKENGMVHGAVVQKYLLEKSRICSQGRNERNYHVFYYLLAGASETERKQLHLLRVQDYNYLNKSGCYTLDNVDEKYEFSRLKQSMEMVGFNVEKQRRLFSVLSAVLLLGNVEFQPKKTYHHDDAVGVCNPEVVALISELLRVKQETLLAALCTKRAKASGETLIINYRMREAAAGRDAMAKCLYGALFDWIVLQLNHALLSKKDTLQQHQGHSIGVLDIFGFEDFGNWNSFEQLCINYANEHLQYYFNQHVFKYEQEEYRKEEIAWTDIDFKDNTGCLQLFEAKPLGLLCILDDQCNFPGATNETLLQKFNSVHSSACSPFYEVPSRRENAFMVRHYAGRVRYQVAEMREKNLDLMRQDIVGVLKNSSLAFVRELVGSDPVAVFRWAIVRAFFRGLFAFCEAGRRHRSVRSGAEGSKTSFLQQRFRQNATNENLVSRRKSGNYHSPSKTNHRRSWTKLDSGGEEVRTKTILFERNETTSQVLEKASQIVMKNKSFRPRERGKKGLKNLQSVKTLAGRTQSFGTIAKRKQPLTVTAQFQMNLHSLMDTLNQANPFFIRCIKSNANKIPNEFDDETVQRQLRYTGMLETVRIRQAGYNVRLTYDEFIQLYHILLTKGLKSSEGDVKHFLTTLNLNRDNYQLGKTKIFMRETEKVKLDYRLHQQIMAAIITIQRWFRASLERKRFIRSRCAAITIQAWWRSILAQKELCQLREQVAAVIIIQAGVRAFLTRRWYLTCQRKIIRLQAHIRGILVRRRVALLLSKRLSRKETKNYGDVDYPHRPARSNQDIRTVIAVGDPNTIAPCKKKLSSNRNMNIVDIKMTDHRERMKSKSTSDDVWISKPSPQNHQTIRRAMTLSDTTTSPHHQQSETPPVHVPRKRRSPKRESHSIDLLEPSLSVSATAPLIRVTSRVSYPPPANLSASQSTIDTSASLINSESSSSQPAAATNKIIERRHSGVEQVSDRSDLIEWKGRTMFTIGGHRFRKVSRFSNQDRCVFCEQSMDAFVTQGHKCSDCKQLFHTKCIQNGGVLQMPCQRKNRKRAAPDGKANATSSNSTKFALTGTSQFTDSTDKIISDATELRKMQDFITKKIYNLENEEGNASEVDRMFREALREFKDNLVATYSIANRQGDSLNIKYKDLITNFVHIMLRVCKSDGKREDFPVTMGVNAFRGFMNEYMVLSRVEPEKPRDKKRAKKEKKRAKSEDSISYNGHIFVLTIINIPTACEVCSGFFMWPIERSLVCQNCKATCHKKCHMKVAGQCRTAGMVVSLDRKVFGVPLQRLASNGKVPIVVDRLITTIEMYGLYTEGIYRKPGVNSKVKELKLKMEQQPHDAVLFEDYPIHVLTSVLKCFFREMPEPLLTFDRYDDFMRAAGLTDAHDRTSTLFAILKKLPKPNFDLMERLIFHLARVASQEQSNRMSASALAIVFSPCILRTNKLVPAQDCLDDISKQTLCIETIISDQLRKIRSTLADIDTLDTACHTATHRLSSLRSSKVFSPEEFHQQDKRSSPSKSSPSAVPNSPRKDTQQQEEEDEGDEEALLVGHIQEIEKEKALLTSNLPSLTRTTSDDDLLSTDMDDGSLDDGGHGNGIAVSLHQPSDYGAGQDDPIMV